MLFFSIDTSILGQRYEILEKLQKTKIKMRVSNRDGAHPHSLRVGINFLV